MICSENRSCYGLRQPVAQKGVVVARPSGLLGDSSFRVVLVGKNWLMLNDWVLNAKCVAGVGWNLLRVLVVTAGGCKRKKSQFEAARMANMLPKC